MLAVLLTAVVSVSYAVSGIELFPWTSETSSSNRLIYSQDTQTTLSSLTDQYSVHPSSATSSYSSRSVYPSTSTTTVPELTSSHSVWYHSSTSSSYGSQTYTTDTTKAFVKTVFSSETGAVEGTVLAVKPLETVVTANFSSETSTVEGNVVPVALPETVATDSFTSEQGRVEGRVLPRAEQRTVSDLEPEATFSAGQQELIIDSHRTILSKISVTETTNDPRLSLLNLLGTGRDDRKTATYPNDLDIDVSSGNLEATMSMARDTTVTGSPSWDGVMDLPRFVDHSSPFGDVHSAIHVGLDGERLEFDKPVRIVFRDRAGQAAAFEMDGRHTMIDALCRADDAGIVDAQLEGTGECRIEAGPDLAVWTYHLTRFYTFVLSPLAEPLEPAAEPPAQIRRGGGGGGGGGSITGAGAEGRSAQVYIRSVSWDCQAGTVAVEAGPDDQSLAVSILSKTLGLSMAEASDALSQSGYRTFVAPMDAEDDFIQVKALSVGGRDFTQAVELLDLDSCTGTRTFQTSPERVAGQPPSTPMPAQAGAPEQVTVPNPAPEQTRTPDPTPEQAAKEIAREPAIPVQTTEPTQPAQPVDICGPGTVMDSDGTCQLAREGGGCLIATAAHGTELAVQVQRLREVRQTVLSSESGAEFMGAFNRVYYSFSPAVADMERQNPVLREAVRIALAPMMATLQMMEFADTEARAVALGILAISLNVAMYGSPAALAILARRRRNARVRPKPLGRAARQ